MCIEGGGKSVRFTIKPSEAPYSNVKDARRISINLRKDPVFHCLFASSCYQNLGVYHSDAKTLVVRHPVWTMVWYGSKPHMCSHEVESDVICLPWGLAEMTQACPVDQPTMAPTDGDRNQIRRKRCLAAVPILCINSDKTRAARLNCLPNFLIGRRGEPNKQGRNGTCDSMPWP